MTIQFPDSHLRRELKIKAKSLASEAQYIRKEEVKLLKHARAMEAKNYGPGDLPRARRDDLRDHRLKVVRPEARRTHLARAFIKGTPYTKVENSTTRNRLTQSDLGEIARMVQTYGNPRFPNPDIVNKVLGDHISDWVHAGDLTEAERMETSSE